MVGIALSDLLVDRKPNRKIAGLTPKGIKGIDLCKAEDLRKELMPANQLEFMFGFGRGEI